MDTQIATVGSSTYESIKRDIIFGQLEPGAKLKLQELKGRYHASVTTLRETLSRLASEGFVHAEDQKGFSVSPISKEDLLEVADIRRLLECSALSKSIDNGDDDWEGRVVAAHHKLQIVEQKMLAGDHSDRELWKKYDLGFHNTLIQACNSKLVLSLHNTILDKYFRYQMIIMIFRGEKAIQEHKALLDATLKRDKKTALNVLEDHIRLGVADALPYFD